MASLILSFLLVRPLLISFFFFNDTATTEIYTLSLHDALPISTWTRSVYAVWTPGSPPSSFRASSPSGTPRASTRSEEHTSELQSRLHLVCRLLLEKKKKKKKLNTTQLIKHLSRHAQTHWSRQD